MKSIIILLGNSHFGRKIASALNNSDDALYMYLDTSNKFTDRVLYVFILLFSSTVYSISGTVKPGGALTLAYLLRKKIRLHFVGSDVIQAKKDIDDNVHNTSFINYAKYAANAPWLKSELNDLNIESEFIPTYIETDPYDAKISKKFALLCYLGKDKEKFYGLNYIEQVAEKMTWLNVYIIGTNNPDIFTRKFENIFLLGWKTGKELNKLVNECKIMLRMTEHDGLAHLTIDALFCKNWVIRKEVSNGTLTANSLDEILAHIEKLKKIHDKEQNIEGREWAIQTCSKTVVIKKLQKFIYGQ